MQKNINPDRQYLINRLGYFRNKAKLSARELSGRLGFSIAYIAKFENGDFNLPSEVLLDIIKILNTTPAEFFSINPETYLQEREFISKFNSLNNDDKQTIVSLIDKLKKTTN